MRTRNPMRSRRGIVMALALFALTTLSLVLAVSLLIGSSDFQATRNYRSATQAHFVAESGISQALQVSNQVNGIGVIDYQAEVANQWAGLWGSGARSFPPLPGFSYTVAAFVNGANPANAGWFRSTATGPEGAQNIVVANVLRSDIPSVAPGAIYLATNAQTNSTFNGNSFAINGNDKNYDDGSPGPGAPIPGISTRTDSNTQEAINSLNNNQEQDVRGLGYSAGPPVVPSVKTSPSAPSVAQVDNIVQQFLQNAPAGNLVTSSASTINDSSQLAGWTNGNVATPTPKITHFTGSVAFKGSGNISGAGIMIVDGDLTITGTLDFKGLVIVRGQTKVGQSGIQGNAQLWGSLWTDDINLVVAGNAFVQYSTKALALAGSVTPGPSALPTPLTVTSLVDCAELPSGSGGCP